MSSTQKKLNSNDELVTKILRTAIDSSGRLGSLYDGYRDRVLNCLDMSTQEETHHVLKSRRCSRINGSNDQSENILKIISVEQELRLSIILKLAEKTGIAQIIDDSHSINEYTRFFLYSYLDREAQLSDDPAKIHISDRSFIPQTGATHIITGIRWGIDVIIILQLPPNAQTVTAIDGVLQRVRACLLSNSNTYDLIRNEESLLEEINHTKVYSNIPNLNALTRMSDACRYMVRNKNSTIDRPISYTLRPIKWLYPQYTGEGATFNSLAEVLSDRIEQYVLRLTADIKNLEISMNTDVVNLLRGRFKTQMPDVKKQWLDLENKYNNEIHRLGKLVIEVRSGRNGMFETEQAREGNEVHIIKRSTDDFMQNLNDLARHVQLRNNLCQQQVYNVAEGDMDRTGSESSIKRQRVMKNQHNPFLHPNHPLNKINSTQSYELKTSHSQLLQLSKNNNQNVNNQASTVLCHQLPIRTQPPTESHISISPSTIVSSSNDETINILLLGETGVGKSTFINALANYLTFSTLDNAQAGKPVVLIPVSFVITVGANFDERTVKFGDTGNSNNEDFDHPGQSVTQKCKSHVFDLSHRNGTKLRIIDTPGFGDTRGVDQDDRNMEHILEYIKNLSHLNAVCFLLKPNESRLNIFFRLCLTQLFTLLGPTIGNNIIFCFTNARSTFYAPGDSAPLLKAMLGSLSIGVTPFKKENTFCFDSESFRYLVALQNHISFSDLERHEYQTSWSNSVTQSNRLIDYILGKLTAYHLHR